MRHHLPLSLLLSVPMLLASACDEFVDPESDPYVEHAPGGQAEPDGVEEPDPATEVADDAHVCFARDDAPAPTPKPPRGVVEPRFRIDESEGVSPASLVPPAPTEADLEAARTYSQRFVNDDGTLRAFSAAR